MFSMMRFQVTAGLLMLITFLIPGDVRAQPLKITPAMELPDPAAIKVGGVLGDAITASRHGRLLSLPQWNDGELITMFSPDIRDHHDKTDWYGEHGGKWLYTTAMAVRQTGDKELKALLLKTADYLVGTQAADGYLGVYSPKIRITNDEASHNRSWDVWNLSLMTLGLLETHRYFPDQKYLEAGKKIGELFLKTFGDGKNDITDYGTRYGISATIILEPVVELYKVTTDKRYLDFAESIVGKMEAKEGVKLVSVALSGGDMEKVGDGKAYQILWNLTALAKLYEVTGNKDYLGAVENAWANIHDHHLTLAGGPWGGVGKHLECFNGKNFWNPYGFIETCSIMSWVQLNKALLRITGEARFAQEIEKAAYNALLGAQYPNGTDWCYHSFSNGRRHIAHFNDCCPSSGAMALEELSSLLYGRKGDGIAVNFYSQSEGSFTLPRSVVHLSQKTNYPFDGRIQLAVSPSKKIAFPLFVRIPEWASGAAIRVNGVALGGDAPEAGSFFRIERTWKDNDVVDIEFPVGLQVHRKVERVGAPQGGPDLYRVDWFALTRGPLVYSASGLIDGTDREHAIPLGETDAERQFAPVASPEGTQGPAFELKLADGKPLIFLPYYEADGRQSDAWRLTWIQDEID
jgi:DUF1680 family protein